MVTFFERGHARSYVHNDSGDTPRFFAIDGSGASLAAMVSTLMGLPEGDPRAAPALQILTSHYDAAVKGGAWAVRTVRSP